MQLPDMVLLDLGLGGSTTIGGNLFFFTEELSGYEGADFTGEVLNEKLWVDAECGCGWYNPEDGER